MPDETEDFTSESRGGSVPSARRRQAPRQRDDAASDMEFLPARYRAVFLFMRYFGFPVIVAGAAMWFIVRQEDRAREDRQYDRQAVEQNTAKLNELIGELRGLVSEMKHDRRNDGDRRTQ